MYSQYRFALVAHDQSGKHCFLQVGLQPSWLLLLLLLWEGVGTFSCSTDCISGESPVSGSIAACIQRSLITCGLPPCHRLWHCRGMLLFERMKLKPKPVACQPEAPTLHSPVQKPCTESYVLNREATNNTLECINDHYKLFNQFPEADKRNHDCPINLLHKKTWKLTDSERSPSRAAWQIFIYWAAKWMSVDGGNCADKNRTIKSVTQGRENQESHQ